RTKTRCEAAKASPSGKPTSRLNATHSVWNPTYRQALRMGSSGGALAADSAGVRGMRGGGAAGRGGGDTRVRGCLPALRRSAAVLGTAPVGQRAGIAVQNVSTSKRSSDVSAAPRQPATAMRLQ